MSSSEVDRAEQQYELNLNVKNMEKFEAFNSNNSHVDMFLAELLARNEEFKWFWFAKLFSLSHMDRARLRGVLMLIKRSWLKIFKRSLSKVSVVYMTTFNLKTENSKISDLLMSYSTAVKQHTKDIL